MKTRIKKLFHPQVEPINKIYIHSKNILHNFQYLQTLQPKASIFPVLKSNAYGHGLLNMTKILAKTNAPYLVVDSFPEYQIVKNNSKKNILLLGETSPYNYKKFDLNRTTFCVYNIETIKHLTKLKKKLKIHIFLDTGMHREGVNSDELINVLEYLKDFPKIQIEGVLSHLHSADESEHTQIQSQIDLFKTMYHTIVDYGYTPMRKHIGNNAGLLKIQDNFFNAYRPGLALYGYSPLSVQDKYFSQGELLKPALSITSKIVSLHDIKEGEGVSYNHTRIASADTTVASIPFGYAEGLPRSASNKILFKLNTKNNSEYIPQIGTICMNLSSLEIEEGSDLSIGDSVEIIGLEGENTLQKLSENSDRIIYEILVGLDSKVRREVV